jgi:hypothetical protein
MKCKAIIQINNETGEKNVCFTQDPLTPIEDYLLPWPDSRVIHEEIMLLASDDVLDAVADTEFRSVLGDVKNMEEVILTPEETTIIQNRIREELAIT